MIVSTLKRPPHFYLTETFSLPQIVLLIITGNYLKLARENG